MVLNVLFNLVVVLVVMLVKSVEFLWVNFMDMILVVVSGKFFNSLDWFFEIVMVGEVWIMFFNIVFVSFCSKFFDVVGIEGGVRLYM